MAMSKPKQGDAGWMPGTSGVPGSAVREEDIRDWMLQAAGPEVRRQIEQLATPEGQLTVARAALRRMFAIRKLKLSKDDKARIEACTDRETLERWMEKAVTNASIADVFA
jgi:hypothetical protein